ncbi:MAG: DUF4968 domain-containing protein, partial [Flavobacteriaceae bacterium]|nr:DUF4968 domain-containing protein [Flavobacteriaceae bacterium]
MNLKKVTTILIAFISVINVFSQNPKANKKAIVISDEARFTILNSGVIRMEWDENKLFEDRASFVIVNRQTEIPEYKVKTKKGWLIIETDALKLRYKKESGKFSASNLEISFKLNGEDLIWKPGIVNKGNLLGTTRTLDGYDGDKTWDGSPIPLEDGILSKDGWYLLDDSSSFLFDEEDWDWVSETKNTSEQDWYFFAYGSDYKKALKDYTTIAGKIPMPPRYAFGYWWSRYWAYSDREFKDLVA